MSLVRWFRKNNKKIMAVVVIVLMVGFIGGSYLQQLGRRRAGGKETVAYYGDKKITNYDLSVAQRELAILKMVRADIMLRSMISPVFRIQNLHPLVLGQLLFPSREVSPSLSNFIKRAIKANYYRLSNKQVHDIYTGSMAANIYWFLLDKEAQQAGVRISREHAGNQLARSIPELTGGMTYSQLINSIVSQRGIPEKDILDTFAKLLTVLEYAQMICLDEGITDSQIRHAVSRENEIIDVNFVLLNSSLFAKSRPEPAEQELISHFEKYKQYYNGTVSADNPYGFGYKIADRAQLEYMAVDLSDVSLIVTRPEHQELEDYYQRNREQFVEQVLSDPNDPNSPPAERIKSYAEVANFISAQLLQERINSKAKQILAEAKAETETAFEDLGTEPSQLNNEQFKEAAMAGDYEAVAEKLSAKYKINIYSGRTGMLSAAEMRMDPQLGTLYLGGAGYNPVGLTLVVFAVDELSASELGPFEAPKPRLYENILPVMDLTGQMILVAKVVNTTKAFVPDSIDQSFDVRKLKVGQIEEESGEEFFAVRQRVVEDMKELVAMDITRQRAEEFTESAAKIGWDAAVEEFNSRYGREFAEAGSDPNILRIENLSNLGRLSATRLAALAAQNLGTPTVHLSINDGKMEAQFADSLYSLVPAAKEKLADESLIMEFKPGMSFYVIKDISIRRVNQDEFEKVKAIRAYKEEVFEAQALALIHYNPENIIERMHFRLLSEDEGPAEPNQPVVSEENSE